MLSVRLGMGIFMGILCKYFMNNIIITAPHYSLCGGFGFQYLF